MCACAIHPSVCTYMSVYACVVSSFTFCRYLHSRGGFIDNRSLKWSSLGGDDEDRERRGVCYRWNDRLFKRRAQRRQRQLKFSDRLRADFDNGKSENERARERERERTRSASSLASRFPRDFSGVATALRCTLSVSSIDRKQIYIDTCLCEMYSIRIHIRAVVQTDLALRPAGYYYFIVEREINVWCLYLPRLSAFP